MLTGPISVASPYTRSVSAVSGRTRAVAGLPSWSSSGLMFSVRHPVPAVIPGVVHRDDRVLRQHVRVADGELVGLEVLEGGVVPRAHVVAVARELGDVLGHRRQRRHAVDVAGERALADRGVGAVLGEEERRLVLDRRQVVRVLDPHREVAAEAAAHHPRAITAHVPRRPDARAEVVGIGLRQRAHRMADVPEHLVGAVLGEPVVALVHVLVHVVAQPEIQRQHANRCASRPAGSR